MLPFLTVQPSLKRRLPTSHQISPPVSTTGGRPYGGQPQASLAGPRPQSPLLKGWPATLARRLILYAARMSLQQREGRSRLVILLIGARGQSGSLGDEPISPRRVQAR